MDPQSEKAPGLHLPQPSTNEGVPFRVQYEDMPQKTEAFSASPEHGPSRPGAVRPTTTTPLLTQAVGPADNSQPVAAQQAVSLDDVAADDLDKEWVNKAKMIVERTKDDPYTQSKEISRAKADYMKIRYNKHIKVAPDPTS